jgi:hypothetical protein
VAAGKSPREAEEWVARVDEANTALIEAAAGGADEVLDLTVWAGSVRTGRQAG